MKKKFRLRKDRPTLWVRPVRLKRRQAVDIWYRIIDSDYGMCYSSKRHGDTTSMHIPRKHKAYCGWDIDRQRFIIRPFRGRHSRRRSIKYGWRKRAYG